MPLLEIAREQESNNARELALKLERQEQLQMARQQTSNSTLDKAFRVRDEEWMTYEPKEVQVSSKIAFDNTDNLEQSTHSVSKKRLWFWKQISMVNLIISTPLCLRP